ncbi:DUF1624 domain-containing protein [Candidatus Peribacteria bacterium]|nr:DUF1624 domain-containing protein [Candidatus Peribacteria bacterium]
MKQRYIELDLLRTAAVIMMVLYHAVYDLQMIEGWDIDVFSDGWIFFARTTASLFLLLVGCSFAISWDRHGASHKYPKYLRRGLGLLACGMLVSLVTYMYDPETYVLFGILHCIGVSILLLPFFARLKGWNAVVGIVMIGLGLGLGLGSGMAAHTGLFLPFGIIPPDFTTVDYFPLIPWFGVVLIGYALGYFFYVGHRSDILRPERPRWIHTIRWMTWPGHHALLIYLLHQPILLAILGCVGYVGFL